MNNLIQRKAINKFVVTIILLSLLFLSFGSSAGSQGPDSIPGRFVIFRAGETDVFTYLPPPEEFEIGIKTATITVNYFGSWTSAAKAAFQYAMGIWESQIDSTVTIVVDATWTPLGSGILGGAKAAVFRRNFTNAPRPDTWYPVALANKLAGYDLEPAEPDIEAEFNSSGVSWYYGTDGNTPAGQYDLVTTILHEVCHGLGFSGSMTVDAFSQGSWGYGSGLPFVYDHFTVNGSGQSLIDTSLFPNPSVLLGNELTSNNIFFNGPNARAAAGGTNPKLYAPYPWEQGSSYSHLDENTYAPGDPDALMTPVGNPAEANHDPGPITRGMFKDMGWTVSGGGPPNAPTNLAATAVSYNQINLSWTDNSSGETSFRIERSPNGTTGWTEIASVGANVTAYHDTGLNCSNIYYYRVRAHRSSDNQYSNYSNTANATTLTCPPISKIDNPDPVRPGDLLTYTLTIYNSSAGSYTNLVVTDAVPANTTFTSASDGGTLIAGNVVRWTVSSLASGASINRTLVVAVSGSLAHGQVITNTTYSMRSDQRPTPFWGAAVTTLVQEQGVYMPLILREPAPQPPSQPTGRLKIVNETGGILTLTLSGLGTRAFGAGTSYWEDIPAGTYNYTAIVTGGPCPGTLSGSLTISAGDTITWTFYCGAGNVSMTEGE